MVDIFIVVVSNDPHSPFRDTIVMRIPSAGRVLIVPALANWGESEHIHLYPRDVSDDDYAKQLGEENLLPPPPC